jgi:hypothetical protein
VAKEHSHAKNNAYETLVVVYNRKLDVLVRNSYITISDVEEEIYPPYLEDVVMDSKRRQQIWKTPP